MPETPLMASSMGSTTGVESAAGLAPGRRSWTLTVAGSAFGKRSTPRSRNENRPSTTNDITSIVAETGRRTQNSESTRPSLFRDGDVRAIGERVDVGDRDRLAFLHAAGNLDPVAEPLAHLQLARRQAIALHHEHAVHAIPILERRVRQRQDVVHLAALDVDP